MTEVWGGQVWYRGREFSRMLLFVLLMRSIPEPGQHRKYIIFSHFGSSLNKKATRLDVTVSLAILNTLNPDLPSYSAL